LPWRVEQEYLVPPRVEDLAVDLARGVGCKEDGERRILSGVVAFSFAMRTFSFSVSAGMEPLMRLQAEGAMQFEAHVEPAHIEGDALESAVMPSLAAA